MKQIMLSLLSVALLWAASVGHAAQPMLPGTVTRVIDGDTVEVQLTSGPIRVRLNGVDTPERGQPWGREATEALTSLVLSKQVSLEPFTQDRYDRLVANIFIGALNVNETLVREGHAWAYRKYLTGENLQLCGVEAAARAAKRGLWALKPADRSAPWDWRKRPRQFIDYSRATEATCLAETRVASAPASVSGRELLR